MIVIFAFLAIVVNVLFKSAIGRSQSECFSRKIIGGILKLYRG